MSLKTGSTRKLTNSRINSTNSLVSLAFTVEYLTVAGGGGGGSGYDPSFKLVDTAAFRRFYAGNSIVGRGIAQNTVVACPFVMQKNVSITELGIHVQTGGTAGVARLFIFGSLPNGRWDYSNVIYSGTPIDAVAVGTKMLTVSPTCTKTSSSWCYC